MSRILLILIIIFHHIILWTLVYNFVAAWFILDWNWALFVNIIIGRIATTPNTCILTYWEDKLRVKLGMQPIKKFIRHYYVRPFRRNR